MNTPTEPASMAVLLREAARMMLQWAAVFDAPVQVPRPSPTIPDATSGTPSTTDGGVSSPAYAKQELPWHDAVVDADRLPLTFRCPSCNRVRRWTSVTTPTPWPGAVCNACYAERLDRGDGDR